MPQPVLRRLTAALTRAKPPHHIVIAEHFTGCARLSSIQLPLDAPELQGASLDVIVTRSDAADWRRIALPSTTLAEMGGVIRLAFPAFVNPTPEEFRLLVACDVGSVATDHLLADAKALGKRVPIVLACNGDLPPMAFAPPQPEVALGIEWFWIDRRGLFLRGWLHAFNTPVLGATLEAGAGRVSAPLKTKRPDVQAIYRDWDVSLLSGFHTYVPWRPGAPVVLEVDTSAGPVRQIVDLPASPAAPPAGPSMEASGALLSQFIQEVNDRALVVAEIGGREVSVGWTDHRTLMTGASRYIGVDIHPGPGVDVVGDAHVLDTVLGRGSIDAAFSASVLEHLARPWMFAASLNRALRMGGLTFHLTHQSWPLHEEPNDFWRYTDEALRVLFGPEFGFEVIGAGMCDKVAIHREQQSEAYWLMPLVSAFAGSFVLARKVRDVADTSVPAHDSIEQARQYPVRAAGFDPYRQPS